MYDLILNIIPYAVYFIALCYAAYTDVKTQKIKIIDHCKCNVRASKNAEQAFSTQ